MSATTVYVFDVEETFVTTVQVVASSLEEAQEQIRGRVASVRELENTMDPTKARVTHAPRHAGNVKTILQIKKDRQ